MDVLDLVGEMNRVNLDSARAVSSTRTLAAGYGMVGEVEGVALDVAAYMIRTTLILMNTLHLQRIQILILIMACPLMTLGYAHA